MKLPFTTLDVFTSTRYTGNPVAIISLPPSSPDAPPLLTQTQKQRIASEFNLSEIVFLHLPPDFNPTARIPFSPRIDIFTSHAEVPFAGHPTIGSTAYLLNILQQDVKKVITKAGEIRVSKHPSIEGEVTAEIPQNFHIHTATFKSSLTGSKEHAVASIVKGMSFILVEVDTLEDLARAGERENGNLNSGGTYDPSVLDEGWREGLVGTMYFVRQGEEGGRKKYRTRMFGSREDPGTGSASCALGCYLAGRDGGGEGKFAFVQGVEMGRRNEIGVSVSGEGSAAKGDEKTNGVGKVVLSGRAVVVMEGNLEVPELEYD